MYAYGIKKTPPIFSIISASGQNEAYEVSLFPSKSILNWNNISVIQNDQELSWLGCLDQKINLNTKHCHIIESNKQPNENIPVYSN